MAAKKRTGTTPRNVEWVAGLASMPATVTGEGGPFRPDVLVWMTTDGLVLGVETGEPGAVLQQAAASLERTIARPMVGPPQAPQRIRVASPELAEALRGAAPGVPITVGATPEVDAVLEAMAASLASEGAGPTTYLTEGITEPAVAGLFRAVAAFFRAAPWTPIPADEPLALSIEELGLHGMAVTTVGQHASAYGFMLFADVASFHAFVDAADEERPEELPPHLAVHVGSRHETPAPLVEEAAAHGWETAEADAIPWPVAVDEDLVSRPMTADELLVSEAAALALAALAAARPDLATAWQGGPPIEQTLTVDTHQGPLAVTLTGPAEAASDRAAPPAGLVADLDRLEETAEDLDREAVGALSRELVAAFRDSPEGRELPGEPRWAELVMSLGVRHFDATIASLGPEELGEILREHIPRDTDVPASEGPAIMRELRAFYAFLDRVHRLEQAEACLQVLDAAPRA